MSIRVRADAQKFKVNLVSLTTSPTLITFDEDTTSVNIYNPDSTNKLKFSFNGSGGTYATIPAGGVLTFECDDFNNRNTMHLKTSAGSVIAEITTASEV